MKLVRYVVGESAPSLGVIADDLIIDVPRRATSQGLDSPSDIKGLLTDFGIDWVKRLMDGPAPEDESDSVDLASARLLAPLHNAGKVIAIGRNYRDHLDEGAISLPKWPKLFTKFVSNVIGPDDPIVRPTLTQQLDYEVELAVVIGKRASKVPVDTAMDYVSGYTIINDVSARDIQFADEQLTLGKNFDTFCPMGPSVATIDELPDPAAINLSLKLNGEVMQSSSTEYLIFPIPYLVAFTSYVMTLHPGDVFMTGTPAGVGCFRDPPVWLRPGDVVEASVEGIGTLSNPVIEGDGEAPVFGDNG